jgi:hypothetical protein
MGQDKKQRNARGLILIQIDGLARFHLKQALKTGYMPFLNRLLTEKKYRIHPLYSGVPSATPVADDLISLCRHPDAGTFIISGWRPQAKPLSFPVERGAHGGPGRRETDAFVLLPPKAAAAVAGFEKRNYLRIADLRRAAAISLLMSRRAGTLKKPAGP